MCCEDNFVDINSSYLMSLKKESLIMNCIFFLFKKMNAYFFNCYQPVALQSLNDFPLVVAGKNN